MTANPLVVGPVDTSTAFGGAMLLDSLSQLSSSLESGDWVAAGLAGVGVALDAVATAVDPLGSLIAAGLGWLMEHLEPLKGWLDDLTGDAGAVLGFAGTWDNVATAMNGAGDELHRIVTSDLEAMSGASIVAYGAYANGLADRVRAAGTSASSMASALRTCSTVVQVVHDLVRDTLAQLVGSIISWVSTLVVTAGLATPYVASQVATRVSSIATRVGRSVIDVISTGKSLKNLLEAMKDALAQLASGVRGRLPGGGGGAPTPPRAPSVPARAPLPDIDDLLPIRQSGDVDGWATAVAERHPTLTPDEVRGIYDYTTVSGYDRMNGYLRDPSSVPPGTAASIQAEIDATVRGLDKLPEVPGVTMRGTNLPPAVEAGYVPGGRVSDPAFWSTSRNPQVAEDFRLNSASGGGNAMITIQGRSGVDVQQLSHFGIESEILMKPGTPYVVKAAAPDPGGYTRYILEEAP